MDTQTKGQSLVLVVSFIKNMLYFYEFAQWCNTAFTL